MAVLVNHVYWSNLNFFANGTQLQIHRDLSVDFLNRLMAPGKAMISWDSVYNYQGMKTVPQLPLLKVNHRYRIRVYITSVPDQTYLVRLSFKDLQGTEISREEFRVTEHEFVVPAGTTSYSITIINAGCTSFAFKRIDLCDSQQPKDITDAIRFGPLVNAPTPGHCRNIFLVRDGKQARHTSSQLSKLITDRPIQVINIDWQLQEELVPTLERWIKKQHLGMFHVISADPSLDDAAVAIKKRHLSAEAMVTSAYQNQQQADAVWHFIPASWYSPNITESDWVGIAAAVKRTWKEE